MMCKNRILIALDPGHGGSDPGAVGQITKESNVVLDITYRLEALLSAAGYEVVLTRVDDDFVPLYTRVFRANATKVDLFVSLHINASESGLAGYVSTWVYKLGGEAEKVASVVQEKMAGYTGWKDGGVREGNFQVLRETKMPAILVEMGFISNELEEIDLTTEDTRQIFAQAIFDGIQEYYLGVSE